MYAKNIELNDFRSVAKEVGIDVEYERKSTNVIRFTLKRSEEFPELYRKLNPSPTNIQWHGIGAGQRAWNGGDWKWRRGNGVCFHGHYVFIEELLKRNPEGIIDSYRLGKISYTVATFKEKARELGDSRMGNPGNIYHEFKIRDLCNCEGKKL